MEQVPGGARTPELWRGLGTTLTPPSAVLRAPGPSSGQFGESPHPVSELERPEGKGLGGSKGMGEGSEEASLKGVDSWGTEQDRAKLCRILSANRRSSTEDSGLLRKGTGQGTGTVSYLV